MFTRRTLPLSALRAFDSAARHLHLQRAGEELGVTQSAISHQVRSLEKQLGVTLFDRTRNRLSLTTTGRQLFEVTRQSFDRLIEGAMQLDAQKVGGKLVIGSTATLMLSLMLKAISQFRAQYPEIEIEVVELAVRQKEIPRNVELAVCYGKPASGGRRLEKIMDAELFPVCSPRLLHGVRRIRRAQDMLRLPLLHFDAVSWPRWFETMGLKDADAEQNIKFFNAHLCMQAARSGMGVALAATFEVDDDLRKGSLVKVLDKTVPEPEDYYLLSDHLERQTPRANQFETWLKEEILRMSGVR